MPKVLIVDDEVDICEMMAFSFESQGFETLIANDPEEAFELIKKEDPDLVISDIRMPKGGGMKLLEEIKKNDPKRPKVFLITGYSDRTRDEALASGAEDVLAKPIKLQALIERAKEALKNP